MKLITRSKELAWEALFQLGLEVHLRKEPLRFLANKGIRTVLDIGANRGQFARRIRSVLPSAKIFSFEPLPSAFLALSKSFRNDQTFQAVQLAIGEFCGQAPFQVNLFTPSSSLLTATETMRQNYPHAAKTVTSQVNLSTLDAWAAQHVLRPPILLKMDVQGYEDRVIRGANETLLRTAAVIAETSFTPLYHGQALFDDIYVLMRRLGFRFAGMIESAPDKATGEILYADSIFLRDSTSKSNHTGEGTLSRQSA